MYHEKFYYPGNEKVWLDLSAEWIFSVTGGLQHEDYSTSHIMDAIRELGIEIPQTGDGGNA